MARGPRRIGRADTQYLEILEMGACKYRSLEIIFLSKEDSVGASYGELNLNFNEEGLDKKIEKLLGCKMISKKNINRFETDKSINPQRYSTETKCLNVWVMAVEVQSYWPGNDTGPSQWRYHVTCPLMENNLPKKILHLASPPEVPEVDVEVVPKPKPIRKSRPQAPAYGIHGPLVLGFAFSFEELHKRALERLPEYRELSQQTPQPGHQMMITAHTFIYKLCDDIDHLWPQAFKGWVRDPSTGNGMLRMPTSAQAEKMQNILQCGEAQWYPDLNPPSKTNSIASRF
ncbi:hypothetical protein EV359DRAFT_60872 [Lentinula novae-zelandiae]|nr:hypothetical protein EV359DRAFT_60872 [Lentinula novae-zelandiae]